MGLGVLVPEIVMMIPLGCGLGGGLSQERRAASNLDAWAWVFLRACLATSFGLDEAVEIVAAARYDGRDEQEG